MSNLETTLVKLTSESGPDTWYGVQDARDRKLIQDRLAQRARRKRLAESKPKQQFKEASSQVIRLAPRLPRSLPSGVAGVSLLGRTVPSTEIKFPALKTTSLEATQLSQYQAPRITCPSAGLATFDPGMDPYFLNMPIFSIFSALQNNSRMLGLSCLYPSFRQSPPGSPDLPLALHPVSLQMELAHLPYIDCLPLPRLRHNLILFNGLVDGEAFCFDLTTSSTFIAAGSQSWEPKGWVFSPEFKQRWAFLFS